jgi:hypothetical protein
MLLDRSIYLQILQHSLHVIGTVPAETEPFAHISLPGIFPEDVYQQLLQTFPSDACYIKANPTHHSNEYGGSTRRRIQMCETSFQSLPEPTHTLWATIRAAISSVPFRNAIFSKLAAGLCRRFGNSADQLAQIPAFPRGVLYRETEGYRIAPHPDTREKIVTMQFALPGDDSQRHIGTEFYTRSFNPLSLLREPRGFIVAKSMPFLPNHAYAFAVLNDIGLKSWHGRCTIPPMTGIRNTLLHIWYTTPDSTHADLELYQQFLETPQQTRRAA